MSASVMLLVDTSLAAPSQAGKGLELSGLRCHADGGTQAEVKGLYR